jgi:murein L,D-transpeptidase YcbB/YkuD
LDRQPPLLDPRKVIDAAAVTSTPDAYLRSLHPQHPQFERLRRLYIAARHTDPREDDVTNGKGKGAKKRANAQPTREKILVNMEQWRWMPDDLGRFHVWVNVPEYMVRVIKDGREVHAERVVVGRQTTPTPIFSDEMQYIIFHPYWNVPDSIKNNELLPSLQMGDYSVLSRQNLRIALRGRDVDPATIDWGRADMRKYHIYQPPGGGNALGLVKFLFPNKHDVYLHDTPSKGLFESQTRAYSHGCIRVRQPMKLAEVLLGEDQGWSPNRVTMTVQRGPQDNQVNMRGKIPVHLTYFTMWVDDDGRVRTFTDVYDHEHRVAYGLAGKPHLIRREPEPPPPPVVQVRRPSRSWTVTTEPIERRRSYGYGSTGSRSSGGSRSRSSNSDTDWIRKVFQY